MLRSIPAIFLVLTLLGPMLSAWVPQRVLCGMCDMERGTCCCAKLARQQDARGPVCRCPAHEQPAASIAAEIPALLPGRVPVPAPVLPDGPQLVSEALFDQASPPLLERPPRG
jgi:hypothetical protein